MKFDRVLSEAPVTTGKAVLVTPFLVTSAQAFNMFLARFALPALLAAATAGCAVINSNGHIKDSYTEAGLVYSLPKGALQLIAERKKIAAEDIKKAKDAADGAKAKAEVSAKAAEEAKAKLAQLEGELKVAPEAAKKPLEEKVALAKATADYATIVTEADALAAKAAKEEYDAVADKINEWIESATLAVLPNVADPTARYVADLSHNVTRDDNIKLSVANGLLTSSTATSTDQLPNILLAIAQTIAIGRVDVPQKAAAYHSESSKAAKPDVTNCKEYNVSLVFDPTNALDTYLKLEELSKVEQVPGFSIRVGAISTDSLGAKPTVTAPTGPSCGAACDGLYYRVPTTIETQMKSKSITGCDLKSAPIAFSSLVVVPDSTYTYLMPTRAGAFTTSKLTFAFKEGMPVDYSVEQPSEVASIAMVPVNIAKALVSIPAELLQLRVNHDSQANALIAAHTAEATAQIEQLRAQQNLEAAKAAAAAGLPIPPPADIATEESE